eukprot:5269761-Pyramimonas_sp.AAC.1
MVDSLLAHRRTRDVCCCSSNLPMRWVMELMRSCSPASTAWQASQRTKAHTVRCGPPAHSPQRC